MGSFCCCLQMEDFEDYANRSSLFYRNCVCLSCFLQHFCQVYSSLFRRGEVQAIPSSVQGAALTSTTSTDDYLAEMYRAPPRPLPYDADPRYFRLQQDGLLSRHEKGSSNSHEDSELLRRSDIDADSEPLSARNKWNEPTCEDESKEHRKSSVKLLSTKSESANGYFYSPSDDEDVCPTCLEEYTEENPKIVTKCSHHFHLGCIYEWMERSETCPVCGKIMDFEESI